MDVAAQNGHLDILQFLHRADLSLRTKRKGKNAKPQRGLPLHCTKMAMDAAAEAGHLDVVKWLHENRSEGCTTKAMNRAAAQGHLEVVKWLHENRSEGCTTAAMDSAAFMQFHVKDVAHHITPTCCTDKEPSWFADNQLALLEYLHANRSEGCTIAAMNGAAALGNLKVVQWLHANTTAGCTTNAMDDAAGLGRLDLVKWLHENRLEGCTANAMDYAAANGYLDVVEWLHSNRSEGRVSTATDAAAGLSHFSVVRHENHLRVVQWLLVHGDGVRLVSAMGRALMAMNFEVALFLHAQQPTYCEATLRRIRIGLEQARGGANCRILLAWLNENYPRPATRVGQAGRGGRARRVGPSIRIFDGL